MNYSSRTNFDNLKTSGKLGEIDSVLYDYLSQSEAYTVNEVAAEIEKLEPFTVTQVRSSGAMTRLFQHRIVGVAETRRCKITGNTANAYVILTNENFFKCEIYTDTKETTYKVSELEKWVLEFIRDNTIDRDIKAKTFRDLICDITLNKEITYEQLKWTYIKNCQIVPLLKAEKAKERELLRKNDNLPNKLNPP